jgi:Tol biopolymer transport system component
VLFALAGDTIRAMTTRGYLLVACAVGSVGVGCSARELDPVISKPPGSDAGGAGAAGGATGSSIDAWIAFDSDGGASNRDIYVIRADGTGRRRLTRDASTDVQPAFAPDGTKLAFASDRSGGVMQIFLMDLATGATTQVTAQDEGAHDPAFTKDGTGIGFRTGAFVLVANLDGSDPHEITDGHTCCMGETFGAPVFASDGQSTIYDDYNAIYSTDGMILRTIVEPTTGEQSHPTLSLDASTIALQATCYGDNAARSIWTVPATKITGLSCSSGQRLSATATDATHASFGPDDAVVWGSVTGGTNSSSPVPSALVIWQAGTLRMITSGAADDRNPSWSPTGTVIGMW